MVLAGSEASEIGCLKHYMNYRPDEVIFVDTDKAALKVARESWPGISTVHKPIQDAIYEADQDISFLNLDFCGYLNHDAIISLEEAKKKVSTYGIISYTFCRDRESPLTPSWDLVMKTAKEEMAKSRKFSSLKDGSPDWKAAARMVGYKKVLGDILGRNYVPVFFLQYGGGKDTRAMGILMFQNIPPHLRTPTWRKENALSRSLEERLGLVNSTSARERLREVAMELVETIPPKAVADVLHLPSPTLAAWKAHKTRGTYFEY